MTSLPLSFRLAAVPLLACLANAAAAVPIDFHPGSQLTELRLFPHDGDVVVTWSQGISVIDSESLEIDDIDTSPYYVVPMPVPSSEVFFYSPLGNGRDLLKSLRGREKTTLFESVDPGAFAGLGGHLFFTAYGAGLDLRASDGTVAGTGILSNIDPTWTPPCNILCEPGFNFPRQLTATSAGRIYYVALMGSGGSGSGFSYQLWTRDPAAEFPGLPPVPQPASRRLAILNDELVASLGMADGRLFFFQNEIGFGGLTLWRSDGSEAGTVRLTPFGPEALGTAVAGPVELGGKLYFVAQRAAHRELWRSDGTPEGTTVVHDFGLGPRVDELWTDGYRLYLPVDADGLGLELWTSDGAPGGTRLVADVGPSLGGAQPRSFAPLPGGRFLISLDDGVHGQEPYISDGTAAGTTLVADALPGPGGSDPRDFVVAGDRLFFVGSSGEGRRTPSYVELVLPEVCPTDRLCLLGGRFRVETSFTTGPDSGKGKRAAGSDQTGIFSFFSPDNWEVMVKVLDGCNINDRFWVFASAATDVQYELRVTDLETGQVRSYPHGGGSPAPAVTDIEAFATCN